MIHLSNQREVERASASEFSRTSGAFLSTGSEPREHPLHLARSLYATTSRPQVKDPLVCSVVRSRAFTTVTDHTPIQFATRAFSRTDKLPLIGRACNHLSNPRGAPGTIDPNTSTRFLNHALIETSNTYPSTPPGTVHASNMASAMASCAMPAVRAGIPARTTAKKQVKPRQSVRALKAVEAPANLERLRITTPWEDAQITLKEEFGMTEAEIAAAGELNDEDLNGAYETMQLCRDFENECNQAYMAGKIRGFMHLDNGQESIPALLHNAIRKTDLKHSYYRDHCHALACGVDAGAVMAEVRTQATKFCSPFLLVRHLRFELFITSCEGSLIIPIRRT